MMLTDKAKQDFLIWYGTGENYFNVKLQPIEQYANIIDWLDSVGIYVSVSPVYPIDIYGWSWTIGLNVIGQMFTPSRKSATEAAIKLANDLYNQNK